MRTSFLRLFAILFFFFNQNDHFALSAQDHTTTKIISNNNKNNKKQRQRRLNGGGNSSIHCVDLADFFYEIILSVSAFPSSQGDCTDQEDAQIAAVLQNSINTELSAIPGTINTQNKVCADPINDRRRRLSSGIDESFFSFPHQYEANEWLFNTTTTTFDLNTSSGHNKNAKDERQRNLLYTQPRAFIYAGGGRCLFCFYDNSDHRVLSQGSPTNKVPSTKKNELFDQSNKNNNKKLDHRNLLLINALSRKKSLPQVADILLCHRGHSRKTIKFSEINGHRPLYLDSVVWTNAKNKTFSAVKRASHRFIPEQIFGLYVPRDTLGARLDVKHAMDQENKKIKELASASSTSSLRNTRRKNMFQVPVKEGTVQFYLYSFDLPTDLSTDVMFNGDDPIIVFINGIKLDMTLLLSEPGTVRMKTTPSYDSFYGTSFAGIKWHIRRYHNENFIFGPEPDNVAIFEITAPLLVFDHKNQVDIDFIIKPSAKAKHYGIGHLSIVFHAPLCNVTGMENSPFQDFQSVVESRLFHKLGLDLAHEFQSKQGHCLENKIPVVNVHLVEKETWKDSNPQCSS